MNKMAEDDEYLDYLDEILEHAAKPWSAFLGAWYGKYDYSVWFFIFSMVGQAT